MTSRAIPAALRAALIVLFLASPAAADNEFGFSIGYAQLAVDDDVLSDLDGQGGLRFEPRFSWTPFDGAGQFRLGIGVGFSFFYDEEETGDEFEGFADIEDYEQISLFVPELQVTWRQGLAPNWFVEGGVGLGAVIGNFRAGQVIFDELFDEDVSDWDLGFGVRPILRGGYTRNRWMAGIEASYLFTDLDFDNSIGGKMEELYIALFYSHAF